MKKLRKAAALGSRARVKDYQVGRKKVIVWRYTDGRLNGLYYVSCSLYPEFNILCTTEDDAIRRAENIISFHKRQLEIDWA